jgi:hypothetical protein
MPWTIVSGQTMSSAPALRLPCGEHKIVKEPPLALKVLLTDWGTFDWSEPTQGLVDMLRRLAKAPLAVEKGPRDNSDGREQTDHVGSYRRLRQGGTVKLL